MKDTDKVTLTFGQLKTLVNEARCKGRKFKRQLNEYEIDDEGYDDEGNFVGLNARDEWDRRHRGFRYSGFDDDSETLYQRRQRGKYRSDLSDLPGYGDPATWGGRKPR